MTDVRSPERVTQNRVVELLQQELGYDYLGNWQYQPRKRPIEEDILTRWLRERGESAEYIKRALAKVDRLLSIGGDRTLYDANKDVYEALRYGVGVKFNDEDQTHRIHLIDWKNPEKNNFAFAEEVTVEGTNQKRPDIVFYVNGIALGVLELKRSTVSITEGIKQNLANQKASFIRPFFATMQLVMAGNDTQGLRYGAIKTTSDFYTAWKEQNPFYDPSDQTSKKYLPQRECESASNALDCALLRLMSPERFLEIVHDFVVFDNGIKKLCRPNQYFGVKAAQEFARRGEAGIVWHSQGSGKSLSMVWLANWILEEWSDARVLIVTDRSELDAQIEGVFQGVGKEITRIRNGRAGNETFRNGSEALWHTLQNRGERLIASLIHKFGSGADTVQELIDELEAYLPANFHVPGRLFVFVDEAHRTQSGDLHQAMRRILPEETTFFGFTGTPLLKQDKKTTQEVFGPYIHTYTFDEAVADGVVLDLQYEARDIDQDLSSPDKIDSYFESKTKGLSEYAKNKLKERWGTLRSLYSSQQRLEKIVADIVLDMNERPRLVSKHGNAILVANSILEACKYYSLLQNTELRGHCAVVSSYEPSVADIKASTGEGRTEEQVKYDTYLGMLADFFETSKDNVGGRTAEFEQKVKKKFIEQPGTMRLLIVVDKLLTGFDAPRATYLYIDKSMQDHNLFQAICRVNRIHTNDKNYGYIIDYQDLFKSLEDAIQDYTSGAFANYDKKDVRGLLKDRIKAGRRTLNETRDRLKALCEPVEPPKSLEDYIRYFCGDDSDNEEELADDLLAERVKFYEYVGSYIRAYADLANDMGRAGYTRQQIAKIRDEVEEFEELRKAVKITSSDYVDMKIHEPAMRALLDTYLDASSSENVASFDDIGVVELLVQEGVDGVKKRMPKSLQDDKESMADAITGNTRRAIVDRRDVNPKYYKGMSELLEALVQKRREKALDHKEYMEEIAKLARKVLYPETERSYPEAINTRGRQALYDNLEENKSMAVELDRKIKQKRYADWRNDQGKESVVKRTIYNVLEEYSAIVDERKVKERVESIFEIVKNHNEY